MKCHKDSAIPFFFSPSIIWVKLLDDFYLKVQVGTDFDLGLWGGTGRREELSVSFDDLINISDLNYLAKNTVLVKKPGSYRLQIPNLQISICMFMQPDSRLLS